jgi:hypothetical protein
MREYGRDESEVGIEGRIRITGKQPEDWVNEVRAWEELGAVSVTVEARRGGLSSADEHIDAIQRFKEVVG